jgi:hypothetical protein
MKEVEWPDKERNYEMIRLKVKYDKMHVQRAYIY